MSVLLLAFDEHDAEQAEGANIRSPDGLQTLRGTVTGGSLRAAVGTAKDPKLYSHLARLVEADEQAKSRGSAISAGSGMLPDDLRSAVDARLLRLDDRGTVQVYVQPVASTDEALGAVGAVGGIVERSDSEARLVQARVPISALRALSADSSVQLVRLPDYGFKEAGSVTTQGDSILKANLARASLGVDGTGVRVGVISDGVGGLASSQASGDLGFVDTTTCNIGPGDPQSNGAEGTAMLEIVHDLAPGAELGFGDFDVGTGVQFNAAVNCLAANTEVVVDDIGCFNAGR